MSPVRPLLIAGMRRTGTTILYDAFVRDDRFTTLYEPLNRIGEKPALGGGSGSHATDLFADVRPIRARFLAENPDVDDDQLNHGAPTRPEVEDAPTLPEPIHRYLDHLFVEAPTPVVAKFVRLNHQLRTLHTIVPEAVLAWTVRDPRSVVRSYLYGRGDGTAQRYPDDDAFFGRRTKNDPWSVHRLADAALRAGVADIDDPSDLERVLLVWKHTVQSMQSGAAMFGERAVCLRHEDVSTAGRATLIDLHARIGLEPDPDVLDWYDATVRAPGAPPYAEDPRWRAAFARIGMFDLLEPLGYA